MSGIQDHKLIETFAAQRTNQPFHVGILPGRTRRDFQFLQAQSRDALRKDSSVNGISISQQKSWWSLKGKRVDQLLAGPLGGGAVGHREVQNSSTLMGHHDEALQPSEGDRRDDEEVNRHDFLDMILEEGFPALATGSSNLGTVLPDRGG